MPGGLELRVRVIKIPLARQCTVVCVSHLNLKAEFKFCRTVLLLELGPKTDSEPRSEVQVGMPETVCGGADSDSDVTTAARTGAKSRACLGH